EPAGSPCAGHREASQSIRRPSDRRLVVALDRAVLVLSTERTGHVLSVRAVERVLWRHQLARPAFATARAVDRMTWRRDVRRLNAKSEVAHTRARMVAPAAAAARQCSALAVHRAPGPAASLAVRPRTVSAVVADLAADVRIPDGCVGPRPFAVAGQGLADGVGE